MNDSNSIDTIPAAIQRDRWGRPLVVPPDGGRAVPYTRCTTYVGVLEDTYKLGQWQQRMVATGLSMRSDLLTAVSAHRNDRDKLDEIVNAAREAAAASAGATTGTALHSLTEQIDRGQDVGPLPSQVQADVDAYVAATKTLTPLHIERFCVLDSLRIGGTPDRIARMDGEPLPKIVDLKTGSIEWGIGKIAMQLAVYAHSMLYDPETHERTPLPELDLQRAIVVHLPAGSGTCELVDVDIAAGWEAVQIATQVRAWRKRKYADLANPIMLPGTAPQAGAEVVNVMPTLADRIASANSVSALTNLWRAYPHDWTSAHTELARARRALLEQRLI